jgi:E3 ubiquitin-protein ligase UBR1
MRIRLLQGRETIEVTTDVMTLLNVSRVFANIDLGITIRSAQSAFDEDVCSIIIDWLRDLISCRIGGDEAVFREVIASVFFERPGEGHASRLETLMVYEARMWKKARQTIREVLIGLQVLDLPTKTEIGIQFARVYPRLVDAFLLVDREPDNSIMWFSVQIFTVPSVASYLVSRHDFLSLLVAILYSFFTDQLDVSRKHFILPPERHIGSIDLEAIAFKHKRHFHLLSDLGHIVANAPVQETVVREPRFLEELATFLDLFTGMNPSTRAVSQHVEYESEIWVTAFNLTIQVSKVCRFFGEVYQKASPEQMAVALNLMVARIAARLGVSSRNADTSDRHTVVLGRKTVVAAQFDVASEPVSFHYPLNWLLAEISKNISSLDSDVLLRSHIGKDFLGLINSILAEVGTNFTTIVEPTLRGL